MKIIVAPVGSEGDVRPILALSRALRDAGHEIIGCLPPDFCALFAEHGFVTRPVGIEIRAFFQQNASALMGKSFATFKPMLDNFKKVTTQQFIGIGESIAGADLIINAGLQFAGSSLAESRGIPFRHAVHVPQILPSRSHPPLGTPWQELPPVVNALIWKVYTSVMDLLLKKTINEQRMVRGLRPVSAIQSFYMRNILLAMDPELALSPSDVLPEKYVQTGYWHFDDGEDPDPALMRFIESGPPPVYVGFGSMSDAAAHETSQLIRRALAILGIRAVVGKGWSALDASSPQVRMAGHCSHLRLFPRMAAVVHHGGAGTTYTAARAGVPQLAIPHFLDQYYWGHRIHTLGLGPKSIPRSALTAEKLAAGIRDAIDNKEYSRRAREIAPKLEARDGIGEAVKLIGGKS
jgi:UDP:flavonoid glycosyltransferase YjiC (YdhE family)